MEYRMKTEVDVHDVDFNGVAKTSSIMKYIQSAAQCQLTEGGMSYDNLKSNNRAFILSVSISAHTEIALATTSPSLSS